MYQCIKCSYNLYKDNDSLYMKNKYSMILSYCCEKWTTFSSPQIGFLWQIKLMILYNACWVNQFSLLCLHTRGWVLQRQLHLWKAYNMQGWKADSAGHDACHQIWWCKIQLQKPYGSRRKMSPTVCHMIPTCVLWHVYTPTCACVCDPTHRHTN